MSDVKQHQAHANSTLEPNLRFCEGCTGQFSMAGYTYCTLKGNCPKKPEPKKVIPLAVPERWRQIVAMHKEGIQIKIIAERLRLSTRAVDYVLDMPATRFR